MNHHTTTPIRANLDVALRRRTRVRLTLLTQTGESDHSEDAEISRSESPWKSTARLVGVHMSQVR
jgi:hypothetical protein